MLGVIVFLIHPNTVKLHKFVFITIILIPLLSEPDDLLYYTSCPNCFDNGLCEDFGNGNIRVHWVSKVLLIFNPKFTKSVFFATINNSEDVVLKSMTRRAQLYVHLRNYTSFQKEICESTVIENSLLGAEYTQNVFLCSNVKTLDLLFKTIDEDLFNLMNQKNLWLNIQISIEPLLLKFLSSIPNMPVPRFCGACGDIIAKEYKGNSLTGYYTHKWNQRVFLSSQLLNMAEAFTFSHQSLIFYFMDISPDNLAVDSSGKIFLIDLDHVIIAERTIDQSGDPRSKKGVHTSAELDPMKLTVSPSDICNFAVSDHNYFAVCRYILFYSEETGEGLLQNIPETIHGEFPTLTELLNECSSPKKYRNRIVAGRLLLQVLTKIISDFK